MHNLKSIHIKTASALQQWCFRCSAVVTWTLPLQLYKEQQVMQALLALAAPPKASSAGRSASRRWSVAQQDELRLQALDTLAALAPLMLDDYLQCYGSTLLLTWCIEYGEDTVKSGRISDSNTNIK